MTSRFSRAMVLGALSTVGALLWACGPGSDDRYYCDNGGCYSCDAYGCSNVSAPSHPACTSSLQCTAGTVCTTAGCTATCSSSTQCPKGETCQSGLCFSPGGKTGTVLDGGTTTPTPPTDGGTAPGTPCGTGPACTAPNQCVNGACTAPQNVCQYTSECATGKVCADGACLTPCTDTCAGDFTCTKNVCVPNQTTGDGGTTTPTTCTSDPACGAGKYCNNGTCVVDTRPQPNCTTDADCGGTAATPKKCLAGYCKYTCTTSQYCRTIDARIGYCAVDGVCRSSTEASPQCTGPGTCPLLGQSCIDNQCK